MDISKPSPKLRSRVFRFAVSRFAVCTTIVALGITMLWWVSPTILAGAGRWLDVGQTPPKSDAIWILNGDLHSRPLEAAMLYHENLAPKIVVTSVALQESSNETTRAEHHLVIEVLQRCGVEQNHIEVVDAQVASTFDEAVAVSRWLDEGPNRRVIVVTNDYHTRRSRWIFRRCIDDQQRFIFASAIPEAYQAGNWWRHQDGFTFYLAEFVKFPLYVIWYSWFTKAVIAILILTLWCYLTKAAASKVCIEDQPK